ncbi:GGDEF domain-containing protein [Segnochrobactrum spirostomi]|uniref:diguanylate cyclase n=1 Tax=Segnochrobactrum spirostomi TaxID=2608987 RepID=A0A6A7XZ96_9HYPH|nr:diguanylate cyclase [Segnochrobactrum spirostomi]MQT11636.1 diguanylate cyclase [Segnochrobactrum spirostomi]
MSEAGRTQRDEITSTVESPDEAAEHAGLNPALAAAFSAIDDARAELLGYTAKAQEDPSQPRHARDDAALVGGRGLATAVAALAEALEDDLATLTRFRATVLTDVLHHLEDVRPGDARPLGERMRLEIDAALAAHGRVGTLLARERARIAELFPRAADELPGRDAFERALAAGIAHAHAEGRRLSVLIVSLDRMGLLTAEYGPEVGVEIRTAAGRAIEACFHEFGLSYLHGGDTFAVILPDMPLRQAVAVAENLRRTVSAKTLIRRSSATPLGRLSLSIGAAALGETDESAALLARAARCLGDAQWCGGNRVVCETDPEPSVTKRYAVG